MKKLALCFPRRESPWAAAGMLILASQSWAAEPVDLGALASGGSQWPLYNLNYSGDRFSPLTEITPQNASSLRERCRIKLADVGVFQSGLITVDGLIYATVGRVTLAVNAGDCKVVWTHVYEPDQLDMWPSNRGVAYLNGRVFRGTGDGRLIALDAQTGQLLWKDVLGDPGFGEFVSAAPLAWNGLIYVGIAGGDWGIKGRMMAFDALSGRRVWRFNTIPTGKQRGADTWKSASSAERGGGGTWTSYALDPIEDEVFVPVGNPAPDFLPGVRPGTNLFTNALVVLDAHTGSLKWWYQLTPADALDRDLAAAPVLYHDNRGRKLVALASKDGHVYAIDRSTHRLVFRTPVTTIKPAPKGAPPPGVELCPGVFGGVAWNGPAVDSMRNTLLVGSIDLCSVLTPQEQDYSPGKLYMGGDFKQDTANAAGWVTAMDAVSGQIKWRYRSDSAVVSGITPTRTGVTFAGNAAGDLLVFDTDSGQLLLKKSTGGALSGGLITYQQGGRQLVAMASGGVARGVGGVAGAPTLIVMQIEAGDQVSGGGARERGKALFNATCAVCHASTGDGVSGHHLQALKARMSFDQVVAKIKDPMPPMPKLFPGALSEQDVQDLAAYLQDF